MHPFPLPLYIAQVIELKPGDLFPAASHVCTRHLIVPVCRMGPIPSSHEGLHLLWKIHFVLCALAFQEQEELSGLLQLQMDVVRACWRPFLWSISS